MKTKSKSKTDKTDTIATLIVIILFLILIPITHFWKQKLNNNMTNIQKSAYNTHTYESEIENENI